jgi:hypothetical protein
MSNRGSITLGELQSKLITLEGACHHCCRASDRSGASTSLISAVGSTKARNFFSVADFEALCGVLRAYPRLALS